MVNPRAMFNKTLVMRLIEECYATMENFSGTRVKEISDEILRRLEKKRYTAKK